LKASSIGALAAVGLVLAGSTLAAGSYQLVVSAEDGRTLWTLPVTPGTPVILRYVNSLYLAPTEEVFVVSPAGFALQQVRSTSDAVLAYNSLPVPYTRQGAFFTSSVQAFVPNIITRIGPVGRQSLSVGDREVLLFTAGTGVRVTVSVRRGLLPAWLRELFRG